MKPILFLGGGRITGALAAGLRLAGERRPLIVYDRNPKKLRALCRESAVEIARDLRSEIERAEILVLAVRPASVAAALQEVLNSGAAPGLCVSLAAGIPLNALRRWLGKPARWVRAMPSPVCRVGRGLTALCFNRGVSKRERDKVLTLFRHVGEVVEVNEGQFDAFTVTYSSSHGYHALAALSEAARAAGLDAKNSLIAAAHALCDGILYWRESRLSLEDLLNEAATPGGIAAATISAMDKSGYARVVKKGLSAGLKQAQRNAQP